MESDGFFEIAVRRSVVKRAVRVAIVVGIVLGLLNHGDAIFSGTVIGGQLINLDSAVGSKQDLSKLLMLAR